MLYIYEDSLTSESDIQDINTSNMEAWKVSTNIMDFFSYCWILLYRTEHSRVVTKFLLNK